jgi:type VI secretion system secreted protein Hcp
MATTDFFLKLEGIKGESTDAKHKGEIEIESFSAGLTNSGSFANAPGAGGGSGKVSFQDIHFTKKVDSSSPLLMLACATGQHIKEATLICRKAGGDQQEYLKIKLTDCLVSSFQQGGHGGDGTLIPVDQLGINFAKINFDYLPQDATGKVGNAIRSGYDLKANKKV